VSMPGKSRTNRLLGVRPLQSARPVTRTTLQRFSTIILSRAFRSPGVAHLVGTRVSRPSVARKKGQPVRKIPIRSVPLEKPKPIKITHIPKRN
jgi:hypothetical protein